MIFPPKSGVIFDMDGLMLDTERVALIAWQKAAQLFGRTMTDELFATLIGRTHQDSIRLIRAAFGPDFDFEAASRKCHETFEHIVETEGLPVKIGARELITDLAARGVPLAVATSTRNDNAIRRLQQVGLMTYFSVLVGGNEIANGKPAPDIYLEAVRRLGIDAASSFALEDSHAGVRSASSARLNVIMVPDLVPATPEIAAFTFKVATSLLEVSEWWAPSLSGDGGDLMMGIAPML